MTNSSSVAPAHHKRRRQGGPGTDQVVLWVQFPVGADPSHTKDVKYENGRCMHCSYEAGTATHNIHNHLQSF